MLLILSIVDSQEDRLYLEELYERYKQEMHRQAFLVLHDAYDAEDAVQNAFFRIWRHLDKLQDMEDAGTKWYVICAARNAAIDIYRRKEERCRTEVLYSEENLSVHPGEAGIEDDNIYAKISRFPDRERDVSILKYVYGFRYREIAQILGISKEAVKKALMRAKRRLEKLCKEEGLYHD